MDQAARVAELERAFANKLAVLQAEAEQQLRLLLTEARSTAVDRGSGDLAVLTGSMDIMRAITSLAERCRVEQVSMHPRPPDEDAVRETEAEDRAALERGVRMRGLLTVAVRSSPAAVTYYQELAPLGLEMRTSSHLSALMMIIDREVALVHIGFTPDGEPVALLTESELLVQLLGDLFERTWDGADALTDNPAPRTASLTSRQRQVLDLCAHGLKDESIARQLGVSTRTVSTELGQAMVVLGARSRFQAGVLWGQRLRPGLDRDEADGRDSLS